MAARLCAICSAALAGRTAFRLPYVKYSTGADRTTCMAYRAIGKPNQTAARRAFLEGRAIGEWHAESKCLFRRDSAIWRPAVFSSISFLPRQKRYGPRSGGCGFANCTAPPAHSNCTSGGIPRHPAQKILPLSGASFTRKVIHMWMWTVYKFSVHNCATDVSQNCLWTDLISAHICLWTNNR